MTPTFQEREGVLREPWSDPPGDAGEPKVNGKWGQIQDPEARCPDSSPECFPFYKLIVYLETWIIISGAKGRGLRLKHFPVTNDFVNTFSKIHNKTKLLTDCTGSGERKHIRPGLTEPLLCPCLAAC